MVDPFLWCSQLATDSYSSSQSTLPRAWARAPWTLPAQSLPPTPPPSCMWNSPEGAAQAQHHQGEERMYSTCVPIELLFRLGGDEMETRTRYLAVRGLGRQGGKSLMPRLRLGLVAVAVG